MSRRQKAAGLPWSISARQEAILQALCEDPNRTAKHLARMLGCSHRTVSSHLERAHIAMEVSTTLAAVLMYDRFRRRTQP